VLSHRIAGRQRMRNRHSGALAAAYRRARWGAGLPLVGHTHQWRIGGASVPHQLRTTRRTHMRLIGATTAIGQTLAFDAAAKRDHSMIF
jgi:hypothetical protein